MWTDLFQPASQRKSQFAGVDGVDGPDAADGTWEGSTEPAMQPTEASLDSPIPYSSRETGSHQIGRHSSTVDIQVQGAAIPCTHSTQSTRSTWGKHCRLLTPGEKNEMLALLQLEAVRREMKLHADSSAFDELGRTVNLAWRLLTVEGLDFDTALSKAAVWVVNNSMHLDERGFVNVLALTE